MVKVENAGYQQFLLPQQCHQKAFFLGVGGGGFIKTRDYVVKD